MIKEQGMGFFLPEFKGEEKGKLKWRERVVWDVNVNLYKPNPNNLSFAG